MIRIKMSKCACKHKKWDLIRSVSMNDGQHATDSIETYKCCKCGYYKTTSESLPIRKIGRDIKFDRCLPVLPVYSY